MRAFWICMVLVMISTFQVCTAQDVTFGPKVGFTSSHLATNQDTLLDEFSQGFQGGMFVRIYGDYFYFQPEVMYVTKGGIFSTENQDFKEHIDLQSIDLPLIFGAKLGPDEFNFRLHGGPVASYYIEKTIQMDVDGIIAPVKEKNIKDYTLGGTLGMGMDILAFSIDVRFEFGFDNMYEKDFGDKDIDLKYEMFNVSLALKLL